MIQLSNCSEIVFFFRYLAPGPSKKFIVWIFINKTISSNNWPTITLNHVKFGPHTRWLQGSKQMPEHWFIFWLFSKSSSKFNDLHKVNAFSLINVWLNENIKGSIQCERKTLLLRGLDTPLLSSNDYMG